MKRVLIFVLALLAAPLHAALPSPCPTVRWEVIAGVGTDEPVTRLFPIDMDEDGILDVAGIQQSSLGWWRGAGDGSFSGRQTLIDAYVLDFTVGDFTGDGRADVIASSLGKLVLFPATGSGRGPSIEQTRPGDEYGLLPLQYDLDPELELVAWIGNGDFTVLDRIGTTFSEIVRVTPPSILKLPAAADLDGDGRVDLVIEGTSGITIYFGSSVSPYTQTATLEGTSSATGDIDGDGDADLVANEPYVDEYYVHRNDGGRAFTTSTYSHDNGSWAKTVLLTDVTGDGRADLVRASASGPLLTFSGHQSGTLRRPPSVSEAPEYTSGTDSIVAADFTADGVVDLVSSQGSLLITARAVCETQVILRAAPYHVSTGTTLELEVSVAGFAPSSATSASSIDLREGTGPVIATTALDPQGFGTFSLSGLSSDLYSFTAEFSGNADLSAAESAPVAARISDTPTTLAVIAPANHVYGTPVPLRIESNHPLEVLVSIDGLQTNSETTGTNFSRTLNAGVHTLSARFPGNDDYPAARSETVTVNVAKAPSVLRFVSGNLGVRAGQSHQLTFTATYAAAQTAPGTITLRKDGAVVGSANLSSGLAIVPAQLGEGSHKIVATYEGTANIQGASETLYLDVFAATGLLLRAHSAPGYIQINAVYPANTTNSWLYRRAAGSGSWTYVSAWDSNTGRDASVTPGIVYEYRMEAEDASDMLFDSNSDWAIVFSDDPIVLRATTVQTKHFTELRDMINVLRAKASLPAFAFHSSFGTGRTILAGHVTSLYNALLQAYGSLGRGSPSFTPVANGQPIRALQIQQLRDALR